MHIGGQTYVGGGDIKVEKPRCVPMQMWQKDWVKIQESAKNAILLEVVEDLKNFINKKRQDW